MKTPLEYITEARSKMVGAYTDSEGNLVRHGATVYSTIGAQKGKKGKVTGTSVMGNDIIVYYKDSSGEVYFSKPENLVSEEVEDIQEGVGSFLKNRAKIKELQKKIDHYGEVMDDAMDDGNEDDWVDAYDKRKALMDQLAQLAGKKK